MRLLQFFLSVATRIAQFRLEYLYWILNPEKPKDIIILMCYDNFVITGHNGKYKEIRLYFLGIVDKVLTKSIT